MKKIFSSIIAFVVATSMITNAFATTIENTNDSTPKDETSRELITQDSSALDMTADAEDTDISSKHYEEAETEQAEASEYSTSTYSGEVTLTDKEIYLRYFDALLGNNLNSAYAANQSDAYVDTATGSMASNVTDLYIPGKNGLDISINRTFNTASSPMMEYSSDEKTVENAVGLVKKYQYAYVEDGVQKSGNINVFFNNELEILQAGTRFEGKIFSGSKNYYTNLVDTDNKICVYTCDESVQHEKYYETIDEAPVSYAYTKESKYTNIGQGWHLQYPNLALVNYYDEDYTNIDGEYRKYQYITSVFTDRLGKTHTVDMTLKKYGKNDEWTFNGGSVISNQGHVISFVKKSDITVSNTHSAGFEYNMAITDANGDTYYFDGKSSGHKYYIVGISDRYGNVISIVQDDATYSITDTYGIKYVCDKSGIVRIDNGVETELVKYEFEAINSELDVNNEYDVDNEYVFTVIKNSSTDNAINDNEPNKTTYYIRQAYKYDKGLDSYKTWLIYSLPYKVVYPTGLTKHFEYTKHDNWEIGYEDNTVPGYYYTVTDYREVGKDENDIRNHTKYEYSFREHSDSNVNYVSNVAATAYYGDSISSICNITYTEDQLPTYQKLTDADEKHYITDTYKYESGEPKGRVLSHTNTVNAYSDDGTSQEYSHTTSYKYNASRLTSETNGDYECEYTYYGAENYYLPHTITYNQDADTTIKTENLLTEDGKSIATQNTYENDTLVNTVNYTYDTYGNVASVSVPLDDTTSAVTSYAYTYGTDGGYTVAATQSGIVNADGEAQSDIVTSQTVDWRGNVTSATDANGNTAATTYDLMNRPLTVTYPDGADETYTYDIASNITTLVTESGAKYTSTADEWGNRIKYERAPSSDAAGECIETAEYNSLNQPVSARRYYNADSYTRADYTYDFNQRITEEKIYDNTTLLKTTSYAYTAEKDANNRLVLVTDTDISGDGKTYATYRQYTDYMGNVTAEKYISGSDTRTNTYTYDYVGNVLSATDPAGNTTSYTYDYAARPLSVTDAAGSTKTYVYNSLGLPVAESDFMGNISSYTYDNAGRALTSTTPFDEKGSSFAKTYYDASGNPVETYQKSNTTDESENYVKATNGYDSMNRLLYTATYPSDDTPVYTQYMYDNCGNLSKVISGLTQLLDSNAAIPADAWYTLYEYDTYGRVVKMTTPDGKSETYSYDYQDRLISDTDRAGRPMTYTYDSFDNMLSKKRGTEKVSYAYNLAGQRVSMTENNTTTTNYTYNPFGQLTTETRGGIIKSSAYDAAGNRTSFSVTNNGKSVISNTYTYDALGRLTSVVNGSDTISYTYDANSNQLTASLNGSVYQRNSYNKANLTVESSRISVGAFIDVTKYSYTLNGNMRSKLSILDSDGTGTGSLYYYDGAGRLTNETSWGSSYDYADTYTYDNRGNRLSLIRKDNKNNTSTTTEYTYNNMNQLLMVDDSEKKWYYSYDNNGNLIAGNCYKPIIVDGVEYGDIVNSISYEYDSFNRLAEFYDYTYAAEYTYDGDNLRQTKDVAGEVTTHIYDGANVVADIGTAATTTFVRGNSFELLRTPSGESMTVYHSPRGDITKLINSSDYCIQYEYSAFGNRVTDDYLLSNPFEYCGEYYDFESGLIYLRNRYYDPEIGRFLTVDPIMDGTNWYVYCENNPVNFVDPSGKVPVETIIDIASLSWSFTEFVNNPNLTNFGYLLWDAAALITPYAPGSYAAKTIKSGTRILSKADDYVKSGVWAMKWSDRGYEIERALGGMANNFPTIDKYVISQFRGTTAWLKSATSIKSVDITSKSYKTGTTLYNKLKSYVDDLIKFTDATYKKSTYKLENNASKILEIAIPPVEMNQIQADTFKKIYDYAAKNGIELVTKIVE